MLGNVNEIEADERIVEIEMERLREFRNHPFKVKADQQMWSSMGILAVMEVCIIIIAAGAGTIEFFLEEAMTAFGGLIRA